MGESVRERERDKEKANAIEGNGAAKAFETCLINFIRCHILFFDKSTPCRAISKGIG